VFQRRLICFPRSVLISVAVLALASGVACAQVAPTQARGPGCVDDGPPQTTLKRERLTIHTTRGPARFEVQIADNDRAREKGLMFVRSMPENQGMIFDFIEPRSTAFWMHNTYITLDLLFVDGDGRVANIAHKAPTCNDNPIPGQGAIRAVIELNSGVAEKLGIQPGDKVTSETTFPPL